MTSALGLNDHHQTNVVNYIRFARYQRGQRLKTVQGCFNDVRNSYLRNQNNFTLDEVEDMLESLQQSIYTEVENELINSSHTNVLMLRQVFQQAEKWHLKLFADVGELENMELLEHIRAFEIQEFEGMKDSDIKPILEPLNETGGTALLKMEIQRLQDDVDAMNRRLKMAEDQVKSLSLEKRELAKEVDRLSGEGASTRIITKAGGDADRDELEQMRDEIARSKLDSHKRMEDLTDSKHELLRVRAMLELAEKELEQKVSETTPFKNLKVMLQKKNEQLRELRKRLTKYEDVE